MPISASKSNNYLVRTQAWKYNCKLPFNLERDYPVQEVISFGKINLNVYLTAFQLLVNLSHLKSTRGINLDAKLKSNNHAIDKIGKANKAINPFRKLQHFLQI